MAKAKMTPLRRHMTDDMTMRNMSPSTINVYASSRRPHVWSLHKIAAAACVICALRSSDVSACSSCR
jgi:hypothetical protein